MNERPGLVEAMSEWLLHHKRWSPPKLELVKVRSACSKYDGGEIDSEQPRDATERLKQVLDAAKQDKLSVVPTVELQIALLRLSDALLAQEHQAAKRIVEEAKARKSRRAANALFRCLLATFVEGSALTNELCEYLAVCQERLSARFRRFCRNTDFFVRRYGFDTLTGALLDTKDFSVTLTELGLSRTMQASRYGRAVRSQTLTTAVELADGNPDYLRAVLSWLQSAAPRLGADHSEFYKILLAPFLDSEPAEPTKGVIIQFLIDGFRDPRIVPWPNLVDDPGGQMREHCLVTIKKWLALESLELFIRIIDSTAVESMWEARRKFWLPYFERGFISDVTLILASDANNEARKIKSSSSDLNHLSWCKLSGAQPDHSVLLMKIDTLTIAEWSHNGRMRFWRDGVEQAPRFHSRAGYSASELRIGDARVAVKRGGPADSGIVHSPQGTWQQRARFVINNLTGVTV